MTEEPFAPGMSGVRPAPLFLRRVSWGAIFAGLVVALVLEIVLSLLGIAIGASAINPLGEAQPAKGYGIGSVIWLGISSIISIFAGACVAGRLSGGPRKTDGMLHGVATWAVATLFSVFLLTSAVGNILGGATRLLGQTASVDIQTAPSTEELTPTGRGGGTGMEAGPGLPADVPQNPELVAVLTRMFSRGGAAADPQDRDAAVNLLTSQGEMSRDEAVRAVDRWDQQYQQTKAQTREKTREVGAAAASGVAKAAWWSFALLVLGAIAAALGGRIGTRGLSYIEPRAPATA